MNTTSSGSGVALLDQWLFIKKGYSLWAHLVPFAIASLLLVVLSVPQENLLLKLAAALASPGWVWLPAALLTVVTTGLYLLSLRSQIARADLFPKHLVRRTLLTGGFYLLLCTGMAYAVLATTPGPRLTGADLWACWMVASLSLTGIGWKGPEGWAEAIHLQMPDYDDCHVAALQAAKSLEDLRQPKGLKLESFQQFTDQLSSLRKGIEGNLPLEPDWRRSDAEQAAGALRLLEAQIKASIGDTPDQTNLQKFADISRGKRKTEKELSQAFEEVFKYWSDWRVKERSP